MFKKNIFWLIYKKIVKFKKSISLNNNEDKKW